MALYEKLLSNTVSYGYLSEAVIEGELEKTETNKKASLATKELVKAVEGIQETVAQLSRWVERVSSLVIKLSFSTRVYP